MMMDEGPHQVRFLLGRTMATKVAVHAIGEEGVMSALARHHAGDWGDLGEEDKQANESAIRHGARIVSRYSIQSIQEADLEEAVYVITEADRSATTVLLCSEY